MLKNALLIKTIGTITLSSFIATVIPQKTLANDLYPLSFSKMYNLAQAGEVEALRASVRRGMNIDSLDSDGNTGLCIAARNHDAYTYNVFRAAGANPRHPCVQKISDYEDFVNTSKAVPISSTTREAYGSLGKEEYKISPVVWWVLGGLVVGGGIAAIIASSSGGSSHKKSTTNPEEYDNVADKLASKGNVSRSTTGSSVNNRNITVENKKTDQIVKMDFNKSVLELSEYFDVALKASKGGVFTNSAGTNLQLSSGATGMAATVGSSVYNNGYINVDAYNAGIGMLASEDSTAVNNGSGIIKGTSTNGIDINFSGYDESNMAIGMYADTKSTIINNGDIRGSAIKASEKPKTSNDSSDNNSSTDNSSSGNSLSEYLSGDNTSSNNSEDTQTTISTSSNGKIVGMEAMIINAGKDVQNTNITVKNNGNIQLSAGDRNNTNGEIKVGLIAMASYLDDSFMNGSKDIMRAEKVTLTNSGNINLGYTGTYTTQAETSLRKGLGGIVGMRADANTTAYNDGSILISLTNDTSASGSNSSNYDIAAGLQSVHGGSIYNHENGIITINTSAPNARISYGMLSVEGSGTVSGLYTYLDHTLLNEGKIQMTASNNYGMASYNGGVLQNKGQIVLGTESNTLYSNNIGMYGSFEGERVTLLNTGTIDIYSNKSIAMANDYAGDTVLVNDGIINIYKNAIDSKVFGGNYSQLVNNGTINYWPTSVSDQSPEESENVNYNPFATFKMLSYASIMSTKAEAIKGGSADTSSTTEELYNKGEINIYGSSYVSALAVETKQGTAYNNGSINLLNRSDLVKSIGQIGMYLSDDALYTANLTNNKGASIISDVKYSVGMGSNSTKDVAIFNAGNITLNGDRSIGIYSAQGGNITNSATGIITVNSNETAGIYATNGSVIQNYGTINITENAHDSYGIYVYNNIGSTEAYNSNGGTINVAGTNSYGMFVYITDSSDTQTQIKVSNTSKINVTGNNSYGMFVYYKNSKEERQDIIVKNDGEINVSGSTNQDIGTIGPEDENSNLTTSSIIRTSSSPRSLKLINSGKISTDNDVNLGNKNSTDKVIVAKGGSYQAKSFTGTAYADSSIVTDDFATQYINENSFIGEDKGMDIVSDSYMYKASKQLNSQGNTDVVMEQKPFDELVNNSQLSAYLNNNYDKRQGNTLFNQLKTAENKDQFDNYVDQIFGQSMLSNITKQSLDIEKLSSSAVNDNLLTPTSNTVRYKADIAIYKNKVGNKQYASGYKDKVISAYGFRDEQISASTRWGAGLNIARSDSKFNDHSTRYNNLLEVYASALINHNNTSLLIKPKTGLAYGHYRRSTPNLFYKADTKEYYYGIDTVLQHNIQTSYALIIPQIGFNLTGLYMDSIHENNKGLKINHKNTVSAQSLAGVDVQKQFAVNDNQSLKLAVGGWYYHEFGNKYKLNGNYREMTGSYSILSNRLQRNSGLLRFKAQYKYNKSSLGGSIYAPIEQKHNVIYLFNFGYEF